MDKTWRSPLSSIWNGMKQRCYNKKDSSYYRYGGRGIMVCDRWLHSISNFIEDMGEKPSKEHSLDRINNYGNYEPNNCRWATKREQLLNRSNVKSINGISIYEILGEIAHTTTYQQLDRFKRRYERGWDLQKCIDMLFVDREKRLNEQDLAKCKSMYEKGHSNKELGQIFNITPAGIWYYSIKYKWQICL